VNAVIVNVGDGDLPEVYIFNDRETAIEFEAWLVDTDPDNDGSDAFAEDYATIVEVLTPPERWSKSL